MSIEFIDTNVLLYAADADTGTKFNDAGDLIARLVTQGTGALSTQVLIEFYSVATRKLLIPSEEAEGAVRNFATWTIHRPCPALPNQGCTHPLV